MNEVTWWVLIAAVFVLVATVELTLQLGRGASLLRSIKAWVVKLIDTLFGGL
jgi:hypothetical protein